MTERGFLQLCPIDPVFSPNDVVDAVTGFGKHVVALRYEMSLTPYVGLSPD